MIGDGYWAPGITVKWSAGSGWIASVEFFDNGFAEQGSTDGELCTRYWSKDESEEALARQIDLVKADAKRLGIRFAGLSFGGPSLYFKGDGEDPEWPPPPDWRAILGRQASRIGWRAPYVIAHEETPDV